MTTTSEPPEPADTGTDITTDTPTTEQPPNMPDAVWDADKRVFSSTAPPEPRSLPWWKQRYHEAENTGRWLHAEAVAERDRLQSRLEAMQRAQVENVIGARLHNPADFWHHADLADVLDDDGTVDTERLDAALAGIVQRAPYLAPSAAAPASLVTSEHNHVDESANTPSFGDLLKAAAASNRGIASE